MHPNDHRKLNIWALPKVAELRLVLLTLEQSVDIGRLILDGVDEGHRQALRLQDAQIEGLSAYLFTFGQSKARYGLQLTYPGLLAGELPPYEPMEELTLEQVVDRLCMHFELT